MVLKNIKQFAILIFVIFAALLYKASLVMYSFGYYNSVSESAKNFIVFQSVSISLGFLALGAIMIINNKYLSFYLFAFLALLGCVLDVNFSYSVCSSLILFNYIYNFSEEKISIKNNLWNIILPFFLLSISNGMCFYKLKNQFDILNISAFKAPLFIKTFIISLVFFSLAVTVLYFLENKEILSEKALFIVLAVLILISVLFSIYGTVILIKYLNKMINYQAINNYNIFVYCGFLLLSVIIFIKNKITLAKSK